MPESPLLSVVNATLNREQPLVTTIRYFLERETYRPFQLIVVDQSEHHEPATVQYRRRARRAVIHLEAFGFPRGCERNAGLPIFDMRPNRSLPPLECGFGVKPSRAAKCRPDLKPPGSGTSALTEAAVMAPTPGW